MWRSVWRSIDRFSLQHFKYVINELRQIKVVDRNNREVVIDLLQSLVEIVTYGDRQDPMIFECFMEYQVLAEFVRVLKISRNSRIEAPLLPISEYNDTKHGLLYHADYCLSNDYINKIIEHTYDFDAGDLAPYYMSFLRAVSNKINRDTLCLLVKVYRALKFAQHGEKMIQTAVRALTLNIFNVSDDMVYQFVATPPASKYFSDLVHSLREKCILLDGLVKATEETYTDQKKRDILLESDKIIDDMYYFKDILSVGESRLSKVVSKDLLSLLVFPILLPLLQIRQSNGFHVSAVTSLYIVSQLLQVVGGKNIINYVAVVLLYPYMTLHIRDAIEGETTDASNAYSFYNLLHELEIVKFFSLKSEGEEDVNGNHISAHVESNASSNSDLDSFPMDGDTCVERKGILAYINSENHILLFASLFLLLILAENKDLDSLMASAIGLSEMQDTTKYDISASLVGKSNILMRLMPQTSYQRSSERLQKELDGGWFDQILETLRDEWTNCKRALEEPLQSKNPLFALELAVCQQTTDGSTTSSKFSWQMMVDAVKVFTLHVQLKTFIVKGNLLENPFLELTSGPATDSEISQSSDLSSASFGSEVFLGWVSFYYIFHFDLFIMFSMVMQYSLRLCRSFILFVGSGFPCRIAFSNAGVRDIYLIPVARGISGKLILAEKHPFRSQRGVVIAIAPLAGLSPKIDEDHPTWLHLRIKEFDPRSNASKTRGFNAKKSNTGVDGRWTLGFTSEKACEAARLLILEETHKQRSLVESILAPFLRKDHLENSLDTQVG
ncbi:hypothetical protein Patl1_32691 [Pistacia atlantica]|uniref:Uncharacterized protein n=1 Tax=Pistacia atlantica TaxID=434234 RepID=A0ACC1ARB0_9ROSI|nr:hypothetical protein Patl1_32691 [Pistacia atlantica]